MGKPKPTPLTPAGAVDHLDKIYAGATTALTEALDAYLATTIPPTAAMRQRFRYPIVRSQPRPAFHGLRDLHS